MELQFMIYSLIFQAITILPALAFAFCVFKLVMNMYRIEECTDEDWERENLLRKRGRRWKWLSAITFVLMIYPVMFSASAPKMVIDSLSPYEFSRPEVSTEMNKGAEKPEFLPGFVPLKQ